MDTIIFVTATVVAILTSIYLFAQGQVDFLKKNWVEYRCNPIYMPVAGLVGDDVVSNFTKCTMKGFHDYAGFVMDPIMAEFSVLNETVDSIGGAMSSFRSMFSSVRGGMLGVVGSVFGKIHNMMAQTQYIVIRMRTILARIVGVMYSFVYIFYGGMQTGEAVVNGPVGKVMSFLCFDENTQVNTFKGTKAMRDVQIGDRLTDNLAIVSSVYKMDGAGIQMYSLGGVLVTGSHKVKYKGKYIRVDKHPQAKKVSKESKHLVCLNTTTHKISIKNFEFLDFVESDDSTFVDFKNAYIQMIYNSKQIIPSLRNRTGVLHDTMIPMKDGFPLPIQEVSVGDILDNGDVVRGICKHLVIDHMYVEIEKGVLTMPGTWVFEDNTILRADTFGHPQKYVESAPFFAYQLITEHSMYPVINSEKKRIMIIDELETTEPFYHAMKDTIITSGRFRSKLIVV
jgi:hypothetical protein